MSLASEKSLSLPVDISVPCHCLSHHYHVIARTLIEFNPGDGPYGLLYGPKLKRSHSRGGQKGSEEEMIAVADDCHIEFGLVQVPGKLETGPSTSKDDHGGAGIAFVYGGVGFFVLGQAFKDVCGRGGVRGA